MATGGDNPGGSGTGGAVTGGGDQGGAGGEGGQGSGEWGCGTVNIFPPADTLDTCESGYFNQPYSPVPFENSDCHLSFVDPRSDRCVADTCSIYAPYGCAVCSARTSCGITVAHSGSGYCDAPHCTFSYFPTAFNSYHNYAECHGGLCDIGAGFDGTCYAEGCVGRVGQLTCPDPVTNVPRPLTTCSNGYNVVCGNATCP